jgi:Fe2+ transport system protein FeoA
MSLAPPSELPCTRDMAKSEPATQEWTLASVRVGTVVDVLGVHAEDPKALLVHGIRPGVRLTIDGDAPFGGPRIVRLGGCRLAIDRRLTRTVGVAPVAGTGIEAGPARR